MTACGSADMDKCLLATGKTEKFYSLFCNANPVHRNFFLEMSLHGTPEWQRIPLRIDEETCSARSRSYGSVLTVGFALLRCGYDELHAGLCCSDKSHFALMFFAAVRLKKWSPSRDSRLPTPGHLRKLSPGRSANAKLVMLK